MQCDAIIVELWLIQKLELKNLESYGWHCAAAKSGSRILRHHNNDTLRTLQEIEELKPGISPYYRAKLADERIFKIDVAGETYEIFTHKLKLYAQAIDLSRYFLYRCSKNGDKVEFYAEQKALTPKRKSNVMVKFLLSQLF